MNKTLVFTVALNGYQWQYRSLFESHRAYARRHDYDYVCVSKPALCLLGMEVAWLKIQLILNALRKGYDTVLFVDADTRINDEAPAIESVFQPGKTIYAAKGFSGRINSGVLVVKRTPASESFFEKALDMATEPVPDEDNVGWGENGHIIYLAKHFPFFGELDGRWNNNRSRTEEDFIRHYSHGPLYGLFKPSSGHRLLAKTYHLTLALLKRAQRLRLILLPSQRSGSARFYKALDRLSEEVVMHYPRYFESKRMHHQASKALSFR